MHLSQCAAACWVCLGYQSTGHPRLARGCPDHSDLVKKGWAGCALSASQASGRLWLHEGVPFL